MSGEDPRPDEAAELEALLRRLAPLHEPPASLREVVRARFLEGGRESRSRPEDAPRIPGQVDTQLEHALAREPVADRADPAFRADLRDRFVAGIWDDADATPAPAPPTSAEPAAPPPRGLRRYLIPALAAAAIVLVSLLPRDPTWRAELRGDGPVLVDGVAFGPLDERRLGDVLSRAGRLETRDDPVELRLDAGLHLQVRPDTVLDLTDLPALDGTQPLVLALRSGELYLRTEGDYPGNRILVVTDLGEVEVTGTVLGIEVGDPGLCVCVTEGAVEVTADVEGQPVTETVLQGSQFFVFRRGPLPTMRKDHATTGLDPHVEPLRDFTRRL